MKCGTCKTEYLYIKEGHVSTVWLKMGFLINISTCKVAQGIHDTYRVTNGTNLASSGDGVRFLLLGGSVCAMGLIVIFLGGGGATSILSLGCVCAFGLSAGGAELL